MANLSKVEANLLYCYLPELELHRSNLNDEPLDDSPDGDSPGGGSSDGDSHYDDRLMQLARSSSTS